MSPARAASNAILREWCASLTGHVLSIGSSSDQDGAGTRYRDYFTQAASYTTSAPEPDGRCDRVLDVRHMPAVPDASVGVVFCSGVLEHVDDIVAAVRECWRVLVAGGIFLVGLPFQQPIHRAPQDFWRFTEYGIRYLLRAFVIEDLRAIGDPAFPTTYWVKARKA